MWTLIPIVKYPPTRWRRYCCSILKEQGGRGTFIATGVRWAESKKREDNRGILEVLTAKKENKIILNNDNDEKRQLFETCQLKAKRVVNPIVDWTDTDVWDFIHTEGIPYNPLYDCGFERVGCIGCPLANYRYRQEQFRLYPKYRDLYIAAFNRMIAARETTKNPNEWKTGEEVFHWWMEDGVLTGQMELEFGDDDSFEEP